MDNQIKARIARKIAQCGDDISRQEFDQLVGEIYQEKLAYLKRRYNLSHDKLAEIMDVSRNTILNRQKNAGAVTAKEMMLISWFLQQPDATWLEAIEQGKTIKGAGGRLKDWLTTWLN